MKTAGLKMNNAWAHRALRNTEVSRQRFEDQPARITVLMDEASLGHHGPEKQNRPYLHLSGSLVAIAPDAPLSHGIDEVTYDLPHAERVDAFYEFNDEQLVELVRKGYFSPGFEVPKDLIDVEWEELPATIDALVLDPEGTGQDAKPLVFVDVKDISDLRLDWDNCSYNPVEYFADFSRDEAQHDGSVVASPGLVNDRRELAAKAAAPVRDTPMNELFTEDELAAAGMEDLEIFGAEQEAEAPVSPLDAQMAELDEAVEKARSELREERSLKAGSAENLYEQHVASALDPEASALLEEEEEEAEAKKDEQQQQPLSLSQRVQQLTDRDESRRQGAAQQGKSPRTAPSNSAEIELARRVAHLDGGDDENERDITD